MSDIAIVKLTTPQAQPTITHLKICAWKFEVPRPILEKAGHIDIWLAKCYFEDGIYKEAELPAVSILIENVDFDELIATATTTKGLMADSMEILSQFLIDKGYFEGTVIFVND